MRSYMRSGSLSRATHRGVTHQFTLLQGITDIKLVNVSVTSVLPQWYEKARGLCVWVRDWLGTDQFAGFPVGGALFFRYP